MRPKKKNKKEQKSKNKRKKKSKKEKEKQSKKEKEKKKKKKEKKEKGKKGKNDNKEHLFLPAHHCETEENDDNDDEEDVRAGHTGWEKACPREVALLLLLDGIGELLLPLDRLLRLCDLIRLLLRAPRALVRARLVGGRAFVLLDVARAHERTVRERARVHVVTQPALQRHVRVDALRLRVRPRVQLVRVRLLELHFVFSLFFFAFFVLGALFLFLRLFLWFWPKRTFFF
jgi:hypothetical protein